jgi:hypothetical protein
MLSGLVRYRHGQAPKRTMTPEQKARQEIDRQLAECGWLVQNASEMNVSAGPGVAIREFPLKTGVADYMLYAEGKALGTIEAKPENHTLIGVEEQSAKVHGGPTRRAAVLRSPPTVRLRIHGYRYPVHQRRGTIVWERPNSPDNRRPRAPLDTNDN